MIEIPHAIVKTLTEVGEEKRCMACGDYWPADDEFFAPMRSSRDGLTPRCIACVRAKIWQLRSPCKDSVTR